ncbi:MAG: hypothetical protein AB7S74_16105 [Hyphomicrobium sp.]
MTLEATTAHLQSALKRLLESHDLTQDDRFDIEEYLHAEANCLHGIPSAFDYTRLGEAARSVIAPLSNPHSEALHAYLLGEAA